MFIFLKTYSGQVNKNEREIIKGLCMKWTVDDNKYKAEAFVFSVVLGLLITFTVFSLVTRKGILPIHV